MCVDLTHTSSFTSSDEHHAHTHREVLAAPSRSDRVTTRRRTWRGDTSRSQKAQHPARKKVRKSSQLFRRLNQAQEQQRSGQTGRDGKRCAALLGLTRRGWHPAGRGQLPGLRITTRIQHIGAPLSGAETSNIFNTIDHPDALRGNPLSTLSEISARMSTSEPSDEADRARTH